jgi:hypothetical protein
MTSWRLGDDPGVGLPRSRLRPSLGSSAYVLGVAAIAGAGFAQDLTWPILLAAALTLPTSIAAVPGYYLSYGLLGLVPGANPSSVTGSASSGPSGTTFSETGGAAWFTVTTDVLGVLALTVAAVLNVLLLRALITRRELRRLATTRT